MSLLEKELNAKALFKSDAQCFYTRPRTGHFWKSRRSDCGLQESRTCCRATEEWVTEAAHNLVVYPDRLIQTGAAYLVGGSAMVAAVMLGVKVILWDYRERRSDDPERFADLMSPFQGFEMQRSSQDFMGVLLNLLRHYNNPFHDDGNCLTAEEQDSFSDRAFTTDDWSAAKLLMQLSMKNTLRQWNALAFAAATWLAVSQTSLSPPLAWYLLNRSKQIASDPPLKDWRDPISKALATDAAIEGSALTSLRVLLETRSTVFLLQRLHTLYQSNFYYLYGGL